MNKQEALKKLDEIFDPAIKRCKRSMILNQQKKIQKNNKKESK